MNTKDQHIIALLRSNGRIPLTKLSRESGIAVSTIFDRLRMHYPRYVKRFTALLDFEALGYKAHAHVLFKSGSSRTALLRYLSGHPNINMLYRINNGWDVLAELIFPDMKQLEQFIDTLEQRFTITERHIAYLLQEISREHFLSDPAILPQGLNTRGRAKAA